MAHKIWVDKSQLIMIRLLDNVFFSVSDTTTSLPIIGGMGGSIELRVEVNTSVIADGTSVQTVFTPTSDMSVTPVTTTAQVSGGVLLVQTSSLSPSTDYSYIITFDGVDGSRLGGVIQGVFRTNSMSSSDFTL